MGDQSHVAFPSLTADTAEPICVRVAMNARRERRAHIRYPVNVPAMFRARDGSVRATGMIECLSAGGGFLSSVGDLKAGEAGVLRLMALSQSLRTTARDTLELEAGVVHEGSAGFGLRFLGGTEYLAQLLERTFGRSELKAED